MQALLYSRGVFSFLTDEELLATSPSDKDKDAYIEELKSRFEQRKDATDKIKRDFFAHS